MLFSMLPLILPLLLAGGDPAIQLWIDNDGRFIPGDYARVQVQTRESGYLLVLRVAPDGQLTVLFPLRPGDNSFVRGGERYEIKDEEGREGFAIMGSYGRGLVYAAVSSSPFRFDDYRRIDRWDEQALAPLPPASDPETELTELVKRMASGDFDYDVATYDVIERVVYASNDGFGSPFFFGCSPFFFDPVFQCPFLVHPRNRPVNREPRLVTRFAPRRFVPGSPGAASVPFRNRRHGRPDEGWPVDVRPRRREPLARASSTSWPINVSPRSSELRALARREGWPLDVSPRRVSPDPALGRRAGVPGWGLGAVAEPAGSLEPRRMGRPGLETPPSVGLRSFARPAVPVLRGTLGPAPR
jgi:uncharacterized protein DUF4384